MRLADYRALTGDTGVNDAALWLAPGTTPAQAAARICARCRSAPRCELSAPGEIRALSLKIFDRSFAVTYLLEAVAIIIGLFGVAATFSAQTLARAREFGMLRHVGVTRAPDAGDAGGSKAALLTAARHRCRLRARLVHQPDPGLHRQSAIVPLDDAAAHAVGALAAVAAALLAPPSLTALLSGRQAVSGDAVRAVREDW